MGQFVESFQNFLLKNRLILVKILVRFYTNGPNILGK